MTNRKIKMKYDEIVLTAAGPVRLFAGDEHEESEIGASAVNSLVGRGFAVEVELTPQQKAALTRAATKAKKEAETEVKDATAATTDEAVEEESPRESLISKVLGKSSKG